MDTLAYDLFWDTSHLNATTDEDATLVPFEGYEHVCGWIGSEPVQVPEPILFEADFKVTQYSDFPCNDVNWPLMSPRMLEVLSEVGDFSHRLIPVRLVNRRAQGPARYLSDGSLRPEAVDDRFMAVQLTEHIEVVDWASSEFRRSQINPSSVYFDKLVLVAPPGGFPPLFRIPADVRWLLVSTEARRALETAGIRGIRFKDLPCVPAIDSPKQRTIADNLD